MTQKPEKGVQTPSGKKGLGWLLKELEERAADEVLHELTADTQYIYKDEYSKEEKRVYKINDVRKALAFRVAEYINHPDQFEDLNPADLHQHLTQLLSGNEFLHKTRYGVIRKQFTADEIIYLALLNRTHIELENRGGCTLDACACVLRNRGGIPLGHPELKRLQALFETISAPLDTYHNAVFRRAGQYTSYKSDWDGINRSRMHQWSEEEMMGRKRDKRCPLSEGFENAWEEPITKLHECLMVLITHQAEASPGALQRLAYDMLEEKLQEKQPSYRRRPLPWKDSELKWAAEDILGRFIAMKAGEETLSEKDIITIDLILHICLQPAEDILPKVAARAFREAKDPQQALALFHLMAKAADRNTREKMRAVVEKALPKEKIVLQTRDELSRVFNPQEGTPETLQQDAFQLVEKLFSLHPQLGEFFPDFPSAKTICQNLLQNNWRTATLEVKSEEKGFFKGSQMERLRVYRFDSATGNCPLNITVGNLQVIVTRTSKGLGRHDYIQAQIIRRSVISKDFSVF